MGFKGRDEGSVVVTGTMAFAVKEVVGETGRRVETRLLRRLMEVPESRDDMLLELRLADARETPVGA